jgi:hypothetical protein
MAAGASQGTMVTLPPQPALCHPTTAPLAVVTVVTLRTHIVYPPAKNAYFNLRTVTTCPFWARDENPSYPPLYLYVYRRSLRDDGDTSLLLVPMPVPAPARVLKICTPTVSNFRKPSFKLLQAAFRKQTANPEERCRARSAFRGRVEASLRLLRPVLLPLCCGSLRSELLAYHLEV